MKTVIWPAVVSIQDVPLKADKSLQSFTLMVIHLGCLAVTKRENFLENAS